WARTRSSCSANVSTRTRSRSCARRSKRFRTSAAAAEAAPRRRLTSSLRSSWTYRRRGAGCAYAAPPASDARGCSAGSIGSGRTVRVVGSAALHHRPQVLAELLERRTAHVPPAVVDPVDDEGGQEREGVGQGDRAMPESRRGLLDDVEVRDRPTLMVAEKGECCAEPRAERGGHLRRVRRDHRHLAVVDREFVVQFGEVPDLALALRSPVAAVETQDERELTDQLGETDGLV